MAWWQTGDDIAPMGLCGEGVGGGDALRGHTASNKLNVSIEKQTSMTTYFQGWQTCSSAESAQMGFFDEQCAACVQLDHEHRQWGVAGGQLAEAEPAAAVAAAAAPC